MRLTALTIIVFVLVGLGCDRSGQRDSPDERAGELLFKLTDDDDSIVIDIDSSGIGYKLLSSAQLGNKIDFCLGANLLPIRVENLADINHPERDGFLLPVGHPIGSAITKVYEESFDGPERFRATATRTTSLTLSYLTAQATVANVVGHNCDLNRSSGSDPNACDCTTPDAAEVMLRRCMPLLTTQEYFVEVKDDFGALCSTDLRSAIASMVSSLAFATAP